MNSELDKNSQFNIIFVLFWQNISIAGTIRLQFIHLLFGIISN